MNRFFGKLKMDKPVSRNNYFFQVVSDEEERKRSKRDLEMVLMDVDELAWSDRTNGDEELFVHGKRHEDVGPEQAASDSEEYGYKCKDIDMLRFRTERQTLRRLPASGAIVFTIRTYMSTITDIVKEEPDIAARMASAIKSWPEDVAT